MPSGLILNNSRMVKIIDAKHKQLSLGSAGNSSTDGGDTNGNISKSVLSPYSLSLPVLPFLRTEDPYYIAVHNVSYGNAGEWIPRTTPCTVTAGSTHGDLYYYSYSGGWPPSPYFSGLNSFAASSVWGYPEVFRNAWYLHGWWSNDTTTDNIKFDFGAGVTKTLTKYRLQCAWKDEGDFSATNSYPFTVHEFDPYRCMISGWQFQGSNDGSSWTTLNTQSGVSWDSTNSIRSFEFSNATAYRYYRFNITSVNGGGRIIIGNIDLSDSGSSTLSFATIVTEIGQEVNFEYAMFSPIAVRANLGYGMRVKNSRGEEVFDSGDAPLTVKSVHNITLANPTYTNNPEVTITHDDLTNAFYLLTNSGGARTRYVPGSGSQYNRWHKIGTKALSSTQVKVGWFTFARYYYEIAYAEEFVNPPNLKLLVCDLSL